jgi:thymidylate synthase (FAD)
MKIIRPSFIIQYPQSENEWAAEYRRVEYAGRISYRSEDKITDDSARDFIRARIKGKHEAVVEFGTMTVEFTIDRGLSHELVRHRMASFIQESTRYCNYSSGKFNHEITVVQPCQIKSDGVEFDIWESACLSAESRYFQLLEKGVSPQMARSVLPTCLATRIIVKANFREWRHIFSLRAEKHAHPDMQLVMKSLYGIVRDSAPEVFENIEGIDDDDN